jgi:hypothetical protein
MICYIDTNKFEHQAEWYSQAASIYSLLPKHNCEFGEWEVSQTEHSLRFKGCYFASEFTKTASDTIHFTVIFPKDAEKPIKLQFNGINSQNLARKYKLRSYLESEVIESIYTRTESGVSFLFDSGYFNFFED